MHQCRIEEITQISLVKHENDYYFMLSSDHYTSINLLNGTVINRVQIK